MVPSFPLSVGCRFAGFLECATKRAPVAAAANIRLPTARGRQWGEVPQVNPGLGMSVLRAVKARSEVRWGRLGGGVGAMGRCRAGRQ